MKRRRWAVAVLVALAATGAAALLLRPREQTAVPPHDPGANARRENRPQFGPDESRPIPDSHVEKTREELIAELGPPTREGPWYIGLPPMDYAEKYPGTQTLEWHWESGQFLASVHPVDGRWVCYRSFWVPTGWVID